MSLKPYIQCFASCSYRVGLLLIKVGSKEQDFAAFGFSTFIGPAHLDCCDISQVRSYALNAAIVMLFFVFI
jgi:hypothetical protein